MTNRLNLGVFNASLADAIKAKDLARIGRLADHARSCGMNYRELAQHATAAAGIDEAEWESLLYEVDTQSEGGAPR